MEDHLIAKGSNYWCFGGELNLGVWITHRVVCTWIVILGERQRVAGRRTIRYPDLFGRVVSAKPHAATSKSTALAPEPK